MLGSQHSCSPCGEDGGGASKGCSWCTRGPAPVECAAALCAGARALAARTGTAVANVDLQILRAACGSSAIAYTCAACSLLPPTACSNIPCTSLCVLQDERGGNKCQSRMHEQNAAHGLRRRSRPARAGRSTRSRWPFLMRAPSVLRDQSPWDTCISWSHLRPGHQRGVHTGVVMRVLGILSIRRGRDKGCQLSKCEDC